MHDEEITGEMDVEKDPQCKQKFLSKQKNEQKRNEESERLTTCYFLSVSGVCPKSI